MKIYNGLFIIILFSYFSSSAQSNSHDEFYAHRPCFYCQHPKALTLPDSLKQKRLSLYEEIDFTCIYDSTGKVIDILPETLFTSIGDYYYWDDAKKLVKNVLNSEAINYAVWAKKELPAVIKFIRYPASSNCTQPVTNRNEYSLSLKLK